MSLSISLPAGRNARRGNRASGILSALALVFGAAPAAAETANRPVLEKTSFYLTSAGFRPHLANDAEGKKAMRALPPHRFVLHALASGDARYLYAEPDHCVCVFIGTQTAYNSYRTMLTAPLARDDVAPSDRGRAGMPPSSDPIGLERIGGGSSVGSYFRTFY